MESYIALMRKEPDSDFSVDFPDFPGCITAGATLEEARVLAKEALEFHIAGMLEDGDAIPAPSTFDQVAANPDNRDALPFLVDVSTQDDVAERINITIKRGILAEIDKAAEQLGQSRSLYLASAGLMLARNQTSATARVAGLSLPAKIRMAAMAGVLLVDKPPEVSQKNLLKAIKKGVKSARKQAG